MPIMLIRKFLCALLLLSLLTSTGACLAPNTTDKGAVLGGLLGAGLGAAVGSQHGKTGPGAAIGGIAGAVTGAVVGNSIEESEARNRAYIEQRVGRQMAGSVSYDDVIAMTRAGLGDDVISTHIRNHGIVRPPSASELIWLKQQGVSDGVIRTMMNPPQAPMVIAQPAPRPVVVQEYYYGPAWGRPVYVAPCPHHYYRPAPPPPRVGFGFEYHSHR